jgi:hypothetical protein
MRQHASDIGLSSRVRAILECQRQHTGRCDLCIHRAEEALILLGVSPENARLIGQLEPVNPGDVDPRD